MFTWFKKSIPEGDPIPSIVPAEGYGNHSCRDCLNNLECPIVRIVQFEVPNKCSYYWPPNTSGWKPGEWYMRELNDIKNARIENGKDVHQW